MIRIDDYNAKELDIYVRLNENQLKTIYEPAAGLFVAESPMVVERALAAGYEPVSMLVSDEAVGEYDIVNVVKDRYPLAPIYIGAPKVLDKIRGYQLTRGVLCAMKRKPHRSVEDVIRNAKRIAILNDVENPSNIGAIIGSAAAMFVDAVILTPECADPLYRRAARVSVGTVFGMPYTYSDCLTEKENIGAKSYTEGNEMLYNVLHKNGYKIAALALDDRSISIDNPVLLEEGKLAIMLGNEGYGLSDTDIRMCDYTVKIPMAEGIDSLNVAAASAVAFWELRNIQGGCSNE